MIDAKTEETRTARLLTLLKEKEGCFVSGEELSRELKMSRTAVWKKIERLKGEGYEIDAQTRKGYRLKPQELHYGKAGIQSLIQTQFLGKDLRFYSEVDSTNTQLKKLAQEGAQEGLAVIADTQTQGKGRRGRTWMSSPGKGIWLSVLVRPHLHPALSQSLTLAAAVAVCRALASLKIMGLGIKWPNDIMVEGRKLCGILTEMAAEGENVSWVIIGVGVNVNHKEEDFPQELSHTATSVKMALGEKGELERCRLAANLLNELEAVYLEYIRNGPDRMLEEWRSWSNVLGKEVRLLSPDGETRARALDVLEDGRLRVKKEDGSLYDVVSGEISLRQD